MAEGLASTAGAAGRHGPGRAGAAHRAQAIVLVVHGKPRRRALDRLLQATGRPVVEVRTDGGPGRFVAAPNEALEFSGYQEGLERVLRDCPAADDRPLTVVFVNDTLASGHPRALARWMLAALAQYAPAADALPACIGLKMPLNDGIRSLTGDAGYVSTWAFSLVARPSTLAGVRFYGHDETSGRFATAIGPTLPPAYHRWQQQWLEPDHWLRGWYKALPGRPLDAATRQRKELAIYLEHTLPRRLAPLGFRTIDVGELAGRGLQRWPLRLLRTLDKVNVNRLKLAHRLPHLLALRGRPPR